MHFAFRQHFLPLSRTVLSHLHELWCRMFYGAAALQPSASRGKSPFRLRGVSAHDGGAARANGTGCRCLAAGPGAVCSLVWNRSVTPLLLCFIIIVRCLLRRSGFQFAAEQYSQSAILIFIFVRLTITVATCTLNFISFMHLSSLFKPS